jgi:hypothetical protein
MMNGKTYHYCVHHKASCIHTPAQCDIANKGIPVTAQTKTPAAVDKLVINREYAAILHDESDKEV